MLNPVLPARFDEKALPWWEQNRLRQLISSTKTQKGIEKIELFFRIKEFVIRETADTESPSQDKNPKYIVQNLKHENHEIIESKSDRER